jgi:predicted CoA-binding protein
MSVPVGEESPTVDVLEVFLEPAKSPGAVRAEAQDASPDLAGLVADAMWFGEQIRIEQSDEMGEAVIVSVVRSRGQQEEVVGLGR